MKEVFSSEQQLDGHVKDRDPNQFCLMNECADEGGCYPVQKTDCANPLTPELSRLPQLDMGGKCKYLEAFTIPRQVQCWLPDFLNLISYHPHPQTNTHIHRHPTHITPAVLILNCFTTPSAITQTPVFELFFVQVSLPPSHLNGLPPTPPSSISL